MAKAKTFTATLERLRGNLGWIIAKVPFDVQKTWGTRSRLKVKIEVNGVPFRTSLFPTRERQHFILVNKQMQKAGRISVGDKAQFRVQPDSEVRVVDSPAELNRFLAKHARMRNWYEQMTYSYRHEIAKWISQPKSPASRAKRAEEIAERILLTLEAEKELPPQIRLALDRAPNARQGWELMTDIQRRSHLFAVFGYRSVEFRAKRLEKAIAEAVKAAERKAK